jgi:hypothetical protein
MKNYGDAIGNRTRDLPAGDAVHQQTASPSVLAFTHEAIIFAEESSEILDPAWRTILSATDYSFCGVVSDKWRDGAGSVCERSSITQYTL